MAKRIRRIVGAGLMVCLLGIGSPALAAEWILYEAQTYGFRMLVPEYTTFAERRHPNGWGELQASYLGAEILVYAKLGKAVHADEIEMFTWRLTRIPPPDWQVIDQGQNAKGFTWYKATKSYFGPKVAYGIYGVGLKGSYMILLTTDPKDFEANKAAYVRWYESVEVF